MLHAFDWKQTDGATTEATNRQNLPDKPTPGTNSAVACARPGAWSSRAVPRDQQPGDLLPDTKKNGDWKVTTSAKACKTAP